MDCKSVQSQVEIDAHLDNLDLILHKAACVQTIIDDLSPDLQRSLVTARELLHATVDEARASFQKAQAVLCEDYGEEDKDKVNLHLILQKADTLESSFAAVKKNTREAMVKALEYLSSAEVKARDSFHDAANLLNWIPVTKRVYQRRDKITREKNIEVVDVDVLDEPVQKDKSSKGNEIVVYDVTVHLAHMQSLAPKASLISPIINFYIEHLKNVTLPSADTECKFQIFRTQFYEKLKEHSQIKDEAQKRSFFVKLRRWWADENLLEFSFIIVPVFEHCHWSVAILCMPSNAYPSPTVLLLDSLGLHANEPIFAIMKSLIEQECAYSDQSEERPPRIVKEIPKVPKQNNGWDCGLFMLLYIKKFLIESVRLEKLEFGEHWFATEEVSNLRNTIRCLLEAEFRQKALQNEASDQCLERTSLVSQKS